MVLLEGALVYAYLKNKKKHKVNKPYKYNPDTDKSLSGLMAKKLSGR
jgi:hypothetical protein